MIRYDFTVFRRRITIPQTSHSPNQKQPPNKKKKEFPIKKNRIIANCSASDESELYVIRHSLLPGPAPKISILALLCLLLKHTKTNRTLPYISSN
ncbi:hypothetical protein BST61_g3948 [Cercospora zeina]